MSEFRYGMTRVLFKRKSQRSDSSIDLINEQHDNKTARTEFRSEAPTNSNCRVWNIDFKNAQCMMLSLHDSRGVTSASIYNFLLPFAYVSYYGQQFLNLNLTVVITDHNL